MRLGSLAGELLTELVEVVPEGEAAVGVVGFGEAFGEELAGALDDGGDGGGSYVVTSVVAIVAEL